MEKDEPIELGRVSEFRVGSLRVDPPLRQAVAEGGSAETVEPRVLQVLVALARARGAVVTRDDLMLSCWEGRVVGDDAINRVIGRLRRLAHDLAGGSFRIETIAKVGYRLIEEASSAGAGPAPATSAPPAPDHRRRTLIGVGLGTVALSGAAAWLWNRYGVDRVPAEIAPLLDQATIAIQQGSAEGADQAIGLLRRAVAIRPDNADAWGMLAMTYAVAAQSRLEPTRSALRARTEQAIERTDALASGNGYAAVASALLLPQIGHWVEIEGILGDAERRHPDLLPLLLAKAMLLASVGRCREAARLADRAAQLAAPTPALMQTRVQMLWAAERSEEADRALTDAFSLYPTHFAVWFVRFHLLLFTGRGNEALAHVQHVEGRPIGVPDEDFATLVEIARAMASSARKAVDELTVKLVAQARCGAGYAENAIQYVAMLGRPELAFDIAEAYFYGRGFAVEARRFAPQQRTYTAKGDRRTRFLFFPSTAAMRASPRFGRLMEELGIEAYWRKMQINPDFR